MVTGEIWFAYLTMCRSCPLATRQSWPTASFLAYSAALPQATTTRFFLSTHTHFAPLICSPLPTSCQVACVFRVEKLLHAQTLPQKLLQQSLEVITVLIFWGTSVEQDMGPTSVCPDAPLAGPGPQVTPVNTNPNLSRCLPISLSHFIFLG
jgi:hypothetical protein